MESSRSRCRLRAQLWSSSRTNSFNKRRVRKSRLLLRTRLFVPFMAWRVCSSGVAHFDHLMWPTWVAILCVIVPGFGLTGFERYSCLMIIHLVWDRKFILYFLAFAFLFLVGINKMHYRKVASAG